MSDFGGPTPPPNEYDVRRRGEVLAARAAHREALKLAKAPRQAQQPQTSGKGRWWHRWLRLP